MLYNKRHDWSFAWNGENYVFTSFGPWDDGDPQVYYNAQEIMARIQQGDDPSTWLPLLENMDWGAMAQAGGEDYDLCAEAQGALYNYITDHGETLTEDEYRYILSASEGLDGAYAEGYQYDVWRLYLAQPPQFAQVVQPDRGPDVPDHRLLPLRGGEPSGQRGLQAHDGGGSCGISEASPGNRLCPLLYHL